VAERKITFVGGRVFTASEPAWVQAVGVAGKRIVAVDSRERVLADLPDADVVDLGGRTLLPGFIDAHNHFLATGESLAMLDVRYPGVRSGEELVAAIARVARTTPPGLWITAYGFDHARYPDGAPTRFDLDRAAPEHPVLLHHVSGHHALLNTRALALRGIDDDTPDPPGGSFVRDSAGRNTGLCLDAATGLASPVAVDIGHHGPNFHVEAPLGELVNATERAGRAFLVAGLTTVCDAQVTSRELAAYLEARRVGRLPVRAVCMPLSHQLEEYSDLGMAGPFGDDRLWIGPMKFYCDGSLIGGTAAFHEPYGEHEGSLYWEPDELRKAVGRAHSLGWQVGIHAQGDRAIAIALDAIEAASDGSPRPDPRHRIEHAGYPTSEMIERMARLGVITVNQPSYLFDSGDDFLARLPDRAHGLQPLRDEIRDGVRVVVSSDSDVASYRPLDTIAAAVDRRTREGAPIGPDQALTVEEAIRAHTIEAAVSISAEDRLGSIEEGKLADLVVLDGDPFAVEPAAIRDLPIWMTVLDGEIVFRP